ncbi:DsbB-like protein [Dioscorea alata]|uniref:DsbB-like protein n=1 Tax=Dioscorea alata TaxID=55571 RepID=A0ACB7V625_DIOAL|nr:DsbB-like protein [Dioscorea alata]
MDLELITQERPVLDMLIQVFDGRIKMFKLGYSYLQFRLEDVALILGLRCDGDAINFKKTKERCALEDEYFTKIVDRTRNCLVRTLMKLVEEKEAKKERSFIKLLLVYILGNLFFSTTMCSVTSWLADYVDNLSKLDQYAWAQTTQKWLMEDVPSAAARVKVRCSGKTTRMRYLKGCVIALNHWFYEVARKGKKLRFGKTPCILCYGQNSYMKQAGATALVESLKGSQVNNCFNYVRIELLIGVAIRSFYSCIIHCKWSTYIL